mmetsp:Transcript_36632/g.104254  ORF Transcript_36632/g.104254 Transcript_36632/m.104254 type:complete len:117 (+) Transcript_36632:213-563(+)
MHKGKPVERKRTKSGGRGRHKVKELNRGIASWSSQATLRLLRERVHPRSNDGYVIFFTADEKMALLRGRIRERSPGPPAPGFSQSELYQRLGDGLRSDDVRPRRTRRLALAAPSKT